MIRNIYKIEFQLQSGLSIGKGDSFETDSDVLTRRDGAPFIPGSSIAGVYRDLVRRKRQASSQNEPEEIKDYFGYADINKAPGGTGKILGAASHVIIYDADADGEYVISHRDNVALDDHKTSIQGAKFDREIVNAGTRFHTFFEETTEEPENPDQSGMSEFAKIILRAWFSSGKEHDLRFGAKTTRGLGAVSLITASWKSFHLPEDADDWSDFDMYDLRTKWNPIDQKDLLLNQKTSSDIIHLNLKLKQQGGILIRQYSATPGEADYEQLENTDPSTGKEVPVIPGSSWAGAIRHRMMELMKQTMPDEAEKEIKELFGTVEEKSGVKKKSRIYFSESPIQNAVSLEMVRNAIDRFTGGTVDGALYKERSIYNGTCELGIALPFDTHECAKEALAASLADLHEGFLAVGGETSVGRGLFKITAVNGETVRFHESIPEGETIYRKVMDCMRKEEGGLA